MSVSLDAETAHRRLLRLVADCQLEPGSRTTASQLFTQLGSSSSVAREAVARLRREGWLARENDGYRVRSLTASEVTDLFDVLDLLAPEILRRASERITDDHLDSFEEALVILLGSQPVPDLEDASWWRDDWLRLSRRWIRLLLTAAGSPRLETAVEGVSIDLARCTVLAQRAGIEGWASREWFETTLRGSLASMRGRHSADAVRLYHTVSALWRIAATSAVDHLPQMQTD